MIFLSQWLMNNPIFEIYREIKKLIQRLQKKLLIRPRNTYIRVNDKRRFKILFDIRSKHVFYRLPRLKSRMNRPMVGKQSASFSSSAWQRSNALHAPKINWIEPIYIYIYTVRRITSSIADNVAPRFHSNYARAYTRAFFHRID